MRPRSSEDLAPPRPHELLDRVDDLRAQVAGLSTALEHNERLATLGTIAALIAHEFNNILTPVMSYAQMALGKPDDRELSQKALTRAMEGSERAAAISAAILGFVRDDSLHLATLSRGSDVPRGTFVSNVGAAVDEALACMARDLRRDGIDLTVSIDPTLAAAIQPITLQHVVLNLILNARNAMLPGGGRMEIRARRVGERPRLPEGAVSSETDDVPRGTLAWIEIEIQDFGRGISTEHLANIFRPFYSTGLRGAEAADRRGGDGKRTDERRSGGERRGTGLGMTICTRLVGEVGGFVWVKSREGEGTTAGVVVPAAVV